MTEQIISALKALQIQDYIIRKEVTTSAEAFFIRRKCDMVRTKDVCKYRVTVFRSFEADGIAMRGASGAFLYPGASEEEILTALRDAYSAAMYVKNKDYALYEGTKLAHVDVPSDLNALSLREIIREFSEALFAADTRENAFLNSAEIFAECCKVQILSSSGADVSYQKKLCWGEFIAQCKTPQDVEQYHSFSYETLGTKALEAKVRDALESVSARAKAVKAPAAGTYDIVLSGEHLATLLELYGQRAHAGMVFSHYSDYELGAHIQGEQIPGEKLNLSLVPAAPFSDDGLPMDTLPLITDGILKNLHGPTRICRYLGIEPVGEYRRALLQNGSVPFDEMKKGCLYPVSFSDFQMDAFDGHFAGEIRFAYLFTENGVELLTGGSVNGSLLEKQDELIFSLEQYESSQYCGPFAVKIPGVTVAGA